MGRAAADLAALEARLPDAKNKYQHALRRSAREVFAEIAERTGGALLPFDISSFDRIGEELLELVAVLAVEAVAAKPATPAATLLLEKLDPKRLLIGHAKG